MGGVAAYAFLAGLPYVDEKRMAVSGHSMGTLGFLERCSGVFRNGNGPESIRPQAGELFTKTSTILKT